MNKMIKNIKVPVYNYIVSDAVHNIHTYENLIESQMKTIKSHFKNFTIIEKFDAVQNEKINHDLTEFKKITYKYYNNNLYVASEIYNNEIIYNFEDSYIIDIKKNIIEKNILTLKQYIDKFKTRITFEGEDYTFYKLIKDKFLYSSVKSQLHFIIEKNNKYIKYNKLHIMEE